MGRRARRRIADAAPVKTQVARVRVSDETWRAFRAAAGERPMSEHLGLLVEREVAAWRAERATELDDQELLQALAAAQHLGELARRLTRRLAWRLDRGATGVSRD